MESVIRELVKVPRPQRTALQHLYGGRKLAGAGDVRLPCGIEQRLIQVDLRRRGCIHIRTQGRDAETWGR